MILGVAVLNQICGAKLVPRGEEKNPRLDTQLLLNATVKAKPAENF